MVEFNYMKDEDSVAYEAEIDSLEYELGEQEAEIAELKAHIAILKTQKYENDLE